MSAYDHQYKRFYTDKGLYTRNVYSFKQLTLKHFFQVNLLLLTSVTCDLCAHAWKQAIHSLPIRQGRSFKVRLCDWLLAVHQSTQTGGHACPFVLMLESSSSRKKKELISKAFGC